MRDTSTTCYNLEPGTEDQAEHTSVAPNNQACKDRVLLVTRVVVRLIV